VRETVGAPLVQRDPFMSAGADGLDEPATGPQLCDQRLRYLGEGRADDDGVVRSPGRYSEGSVAEDDLGVVEGPCPASRRRASSTRSGQRSTLTTDAARRASNAVCQP
jgi:hypothetical protein